MREAGQGLGSILLEALLDHLYATTEVNRIDLDVFLGNDRARRAYEKAGFQVEGAARLSPQRRWPLQLDVADVGAARRPRGSRLD